MTIYVVRGQQKYSNYVSIIAAFYNEEEAYKCLHEHETKYGYYNTDVIETELYERW